MSVSQTVEAAMIARISIGYITILLTLAGGGCFKKPPETGGPTAFGHFEPETVEVRLLPDGRKADLLTTFAYVDKNGTRWTTPAGETIDGATIPQLFWSIIGGPYEGKYRYASVVHD